MANIMAGKVDIMGIEGIAASVIVGVFLIFLMKEARDELYAALKFGLVLLVVLTLVTACLSIAKPPV